MKSTERPRVSKTPVKPKAAKSQARPASNPRNAEALRDSGPASELNRQPAQPPGDEERRRLIAVAAYLRAEKRGFAPGSELDDWLAAESEVDGQPLLAHQLAHSDT